MITQSEHVDASTWQFLVNPPPHTCQYSNNISINGLTIPQYNRLDLETLGSSPVSPKSYNVLCSPLMVLHLWCDKIYKYLMRKVDFDFVKIPRTLVVKMLVPNSKIGPTCIYINSPRSKPCRFMVISANFSICPCTPFSVTCFILRCMIGYTNDQRHHH